MARGENIQFYDMKARKAAYVPEEKTWIEVKGRHRKVNMRVAYGPGGNKMYRIIGPVKK